MRACGGGGSLHTSLHPSFCTSRPSLGLSQCSPRAIPYPRRGAAMQQGLKTAVKVPCTLAEKVNRLWPPLKELAQHCNLACKSDIQVQPHA